MVCSFSAHPAPTPKSSRPDRWSTVTAILASTAGWRYVLPTTTQPILVRVVSSAIAPRSVQLSNMRPSSWGPSVAKWSMIQTLSKPQSSERRHTSRSSSIVVS